MSDGGSIVNRLPTRHTDGKEMRVNVVVSGDLVDIGGWSFERRDLLWALGVNEASEPDPAQK